MKILSLIMVLGLAACAQPDNSKFSATDAAGLPVSHFNLASCIDNGQGTYDSSVHVYLCANTNSVGPGMPCPVYVVQGTQHSGCQ